MNESSMDGARVEPAALRAGRIGSLDFIRGIAVMGILAANIVVFGQPWSAYMWPDGFLVAHDEVSDWMWVGQFILIDGKMRGLFTLLFGAGMYLFMEKAWERGASRWLQVRRLFWLLLFGLAHFYLIWRGDILALYATMGFVAMLFMRLSAKVQFGLGLVGYFAGALLYGVLFGISYFVADTPMGEQPAFAEVQAGLDESQAEALADGSVERSILTDGTYADFVSHNVTEHLTDPLFTIFVMGFETLPLMLMGMAFYRWGLFDGRITPSKQRFWGWTGIIAGTAATTLLALWVKGIGFTYWGTLSAFTAYMHLPRLPVVLGLAALLALLGGNASGWLAQRISAAGRAAFTNYLGTSILMLFVFHPWAGGLWGKLTRPELYIVVVLTWVIMLLWSKPWLERFRFGPLEWLWRCLTYGKLFALKR